MRVDIEFLSQSRVSFAALTRENTRREIPYLCASMHYSLSTLFSVNVKFIFGAIFGSFCML